MVVFLFAVTGMGGGVEVGLGPDRGQLSLSHGHHANTWPWATFSHRHHANTWQQHHGPFKENFASGKSAPFICSQAASIVLTLTAFREFYRCIPTSILYVTLIVCVPTLYLGSWQLRLERWVRGPAEVWEWCVQRHLAHCVSDPVILNQMMTLSNSKA